MAQAIPTLPKLPPITGDSVICVGTSAVLTDAIHGGTWSSSNTAVATIDSTSGIFTGVAAGTASITYDILGVIRTTVVTVNSLPAAGTITGGSAVCSGAAITLADAVGGGAWSTGSPAVASLSASGVVTGISPGTATVSYTVTNSCGSASATEIVTVNTLPVAGTISGASTLCSGATMSLSDAAAGGTWHSSNTVIATVGATGIVTGVATGTAVISYTVTNSCGTANAAHTVTVSALPLAGTISGVTALCSGAPITLTDVVSGGTWHSSNTVVATVGATGITTGVATGTATISYTVTNSCGSAVASRIVTVNTLPVAGSISGTTTLCNGATTALTDAVPGGSWHSSNTAIATVSAAGIVAGVTTGTAIISYTVTNSCGSAVATATVNVSTAASAGTITGPSVVYVSSVIALTDAASGGTWSASNSNATVSATGVVTGVTSGTVVISYTVVSSCGAVTATKMLTVSHATVSPISAYFTNICAGDTLAYWDLTPGGTWSISPLSVATVSPTGVVTGISAGTATLSYTYSGATVTLAITIYASPAPISGPDSLCVGSTMLLTDPTPGGVWSSDLPSKASVSPTGLVYCITHSEMNVPIFYTMPNGCKAVHIFVTDSMVSAIMGPSKVCLGATINLADTLRNGFWSGSSSHAIIDGSGDVTGLALGTATISYTSTTTGCYRVAVVTVMPLPAAITGTLTVCTGAITFLTDVTTGISWGSSNTGVATVSGSGGVVGIAAGTAMITYTAVNGCSSEAVVTVNASPGTVAAILGPSSISHSGGSITLSDATPGGVWNSSNTAILTVGAGTGIVTAVISAGSANINYVVTNSFGCRNFATKVIHASPAPPHPGGITTTTVGSTVSITDDAMSGEWLSSNDNIATVDETGVVTGISPGSVNITHNILNSNGDLSATITQVIVGLAPLEVSMFPNPNGGAFNVRGAVGSKTDEGVTIEVTDMMGTRVYTRTFIAPGGTINEQLLLGSSLENGIYLLNVKTKNESKVLRFVVER